MMHGTVNLKFSVKVFVLEKTAFVGGRTLTIYMHSTNKCKSYCLDYY
jgi:hypothetical protein